ncbi:MAG TPA: ABC transporter ATP-binding protein [Thermoanaerobaculia bacterium]|nr:ABC transporter ATP-binding protein [Thermoanaerobaculia bacterium]
MTTPLRRLLAYFRPYRGRAAAALLAMGIVSLSTVLLLFLLTKIIDDVLGSGTAAALPGIGGAPGKTAGFVRWLDSIYAAGRRAAESVGIPVRLAVPLLLLAALVSKNVFSYFSEFAFNGIGLSMVRDLRRDAYGKLLGQSASFYSRSTTGDLLARLLSDVELVQSAFGTRLADFVQGAVTIVLVLVYVVSLNARLSLFVLVLAPILLLPIVEVTRRLRRTTFSSRERIGEMGSLLSETLRGHRVIKTYGMEPFEAERFGRANDRYFRVTRRTVRIQALNSPMMEVIAGIGLSAIFVYAATQIRAGSMTVGGVVSFLAALMMLYKPLKDVTKVNMALQLALSSARRVFDLIDSESDVVEKPGAIELPPFSRTIRYENVSFRYGDDEMVLCDLDLTIRQGETVAIVGPSGAGKTTLVNLLPRLYDPTSGRITFDGVDLKDATLASLRRQIGIVTQDTVLFDTSARENIAYGKADAPEESVRDAAKAAFADQFLERLPEGYRTRLGEDAGRLSGGQKQRVAIARALYKDAPILILDEATSQLDSESEALVASALSNLMEGRTTLVIAHRLSTVRRADRILVLDRGRLVESGSHQELLTRNGLYRRLHDMQYFVETEVPAAARP